MNDFYRIPAVINNDKSLNLSRNELVHGRFTPFGESHTKTIFPYSITERGYSFNDAYFLYLPTENTLLGLVDDNFKPLGDFGVTQRPMATSIASGLVFKDSATSFVGPTSEILAGYEEYLSVLPKRENRKYRIDDVISQISQK